MYQHAVTTGTLFFCNMSLWHNDMFIVILVCFSKQLKSAQIVQCISAGLLCLSIMKLI